MDRFAGIDVPAVAIGRAVTLRVRELRLDVVEAVGPAIAAQDDVARIGAVRAPAAGSAAFGSPGSCAAQQSGYGIATAQGKPQR